MAEREGFEPTTPRTDKRFSKIVGKKLAFASVNPCLGFIFSQVGAIKIKQIAWKKILNDLIPKS